MSWSKLPVDAEAAEETVLRFYPNLGHLMRIETLEEHAPLLHRIACMDASAPMEPLAAFMLAEVRFGGLLSPSVLGTEIPFVAAFRKLGSHGKWQDASELGRQWASHLCGIQMEGTDVSTLVESASHFGVSWSEHYRGRDYEALAWAYTASMVAQFETTDLPGTFLAIYVRNLKLYPAIK